jgi:beta-phosphoglucomutase-like phosphatase (HAD superfamily)
MTRTERAARRTARRAARRIVRDRAAATRTAASLRRGRALATHLIAAGVEDAKTVEGAANGLRAVAKRLGMEPVKVTRAHRTVKGKGDRLRLVHHFTAAQVATLRAAYKPRKAAYKAAMARLALAA